MKKKGSILEKEGVQVLVASLVCILLGVLIGYIVLLCINPEGAGESIVNVLKNYMSKQYLRCLKEKKFPNRV